MENRRRYVGTRYILIFDFPSFSVLRCGISKAVIISVKIRAVPALGDDNDYYRRLVTTTTLESRES